MRLVLGACLPCLAAADTGRRLGFVMDDSNIYTARDAWLSNPTAAEATYGHISAWGHWGVTDMSYLFCAWSGWSSCNTAAAVLQRGHRRVGHLWRHVDEGHVCLPLTETSAHRWFSASRALYMENMFDGASAFDQDLGWCVDDDVSLSGAFIGTQCESGLGARCNLQSATIQ